MSDGVYDLLSLSGITARETWLGRLHPLAKALVTLLYIILTVSFNKYDLSGLLLMGVYPVILGWEAGIFNRAIFKPMLLLVLLLLLLAIPNPFADKTPMFTVKGFSVTGGMVSMAVVVIKGVFTLSASLILAASTPIDKICYALQMCRVPKILTTVVLLIFRYIALLAEKAGQVSQAYALRAPGRRGIYYRDWGPLAGRLLLGSIDRARSVYESMLLRGFTGSFALASEIRFDIRSLLYSFIWTGTLFGLRFLSAAGFTAGLSR